MTLGCGLALFALPMVKAQDFPQWRGANRDAIIEMPGVNLNWEARQPRLLWTFRAAGAGYSTPTIVGNVLYCQGADTEDFAFALNAVTGELIWRQALGELFVMDRGNGPRGSITVDGNRLYLMRGGGQLHCLSAKDGQLIWQKDMRKDFGGDIMSQWNWGYCESPIVDGDRVICTPGGEGGVMIALDKRTGDLLWRTTEWPDVSGYCSPIVVEIEGVRQYIQQVKKGVIGVEAETGKVLWSGAFGTGMGPAIPTPVYDAEQRIVYVTAEYGAGCAAFQVSKQGDQFEAKPLYANRSMSNYHGGVILKAGNVYGCSRAPGWVCQDLATGEVRWKERVKEPGSGAILCVNDRMLVLDERTGSITVAGLSPEGWQEFGRMTIPERSEVESMDHMVWTHLAVAHGKLYQRDHDLLFCYELKE